MGNETSQESERVEATFTDEGPLGISMATLRGGSLDGKVVIASSGGEEFQPDSRAGLLGLKRDDVFVEVRGTNVAEMSAADIKRLIGIQRPVHMVFDRYLPASEIKARRQESVAQKRFFAGFLLLPWLWLVNAFHFRKAVLSPEPSKLRYYARASLVACGASAIPFVAWVMTYLTQWTSWGPSGDAISIVIPKGA